jgi:SAM-dependent methyltransferase
MSRAPRGRLRDDELAPALERAWADPERPPWEVHASPIEDAKIALLRPWLGGVRSVLDAGCGGGDFLGLVLERGAAFEHVVGLDVASGALARARRTGRYHDLVQATIAEAHTKLGARFDLVLASDVVYYTHDWKAAVRDLTELVAPGGLLFLSVGIGRDYLGPDAGRVIRATLEDAGLSELEERRLDYTMLGVPRRTIPLRRVLWAQTHKLVFLYRRRLG